jgi:hypothetical protein
LVRAFNSPNKYFYGLRCWILLMYACSAIMINIIHTSSKRCCLSGTLLSPESRCSLCTMLVIIGLRRMCSQTLRPAKLTTQTLYINFPQNKVQRLKRSSAFLLLTFLLLSLLSFLTGEYERFSHQFHLSMGTVWSYLESNDQFSCNPASTLYSYGPSKQCKT